MPRIMSCLYGLVKLQALSMISLMVAFPVTSSSSPGSVYSKCTKQDECGDDLFCYNATSCQRCTPQFCSSVNIPKCEHFCDYDVSSSMPDAPPGNSRGTTISTAPSSPSSPTKEPVSVENNNSGGRQLPVLLVSSNQLPSPAEVTVREPEQKATAKPDDFLSDKAMFVIVCLALFLVVVLAIVAMVVVMLHVLTWSSRTTERESKNDSISDRLISESSTQGSISSDARQEPSYHRENEREATRRVELRRDVSSVSTQSESSTQTCEESLGSTSVEEQSESIELTTAPSAPINAPSAPINAPSAPISAQSLPVVKELDDKPPSYSQSIGGATFGFTEDVLQTVATRQGSLYDAGHDTAVKEPLLQSADPKFRTEPG